jgi:hypothetical protein
MEELRPENQTLHAIACVPNRMERWRVESKVLERVRREYPTLPITAPIPKHADFVKAELYRLSVFDLAPRGPVARSFASLAQLVVDAHAPVAEIVGKRQHLETAASWS